LEQAAQPVIHEFVLQIAHASVRNMNEPRNAIGRVARLNLADKRMRDFIILSPLVVADCSVLTTAPFIEGAA
jgi:hypothetical protein